MTSRHYLCSEIVIRVTPAGLSKPEPCKKPACARRPDGKGFLCAEHAVRLQPKKPAVRR